MDKFRVAVGGDIWAWGSFKGFRFVVYGLGF